jgi:hypothetical protein
MEATDWLATAKRLPTSQSDDRPEGDFDREMMREAPGAGAALNKTPLPFPADLERHPLHWMI